MPYVYIQVTQENTPVSADQKAKLIQGVTDLLARELGKDPNTTFVVIDEVPLDNWGVGGLPVTQYRLKPQPRDE